MKNSLAFCLIFRLGFVVDFLSHAAIVGFMAGAAVTIALQQLKGLLGIQKFTKKTDIVSVMRSVWTKVDHGVMKNNVQLHSIYVRKCIPHRHTYLVYMFTLPMTIKASYFTLATFAININFVLSLAVELANDTHRGVVFSLLITCKVHRKCSITPNKFY